MQECRIVAGVYFEAFDPNLPQNGAVSSTLCAHDIVIVAKQQLPIRKGSNARRNLLAQQLPGAQQHPMQHGAEFTTLDKLPSL